LAGLEPGQDGYGSNEGDRAESGDHLKLPTSLIIWNRHTLLFMDKINQ
jgi:hypothetical protein